MRHYLMFFGFLYLSITAQGQNIAYSGKLETQNMKLIHGDYTFGIAPKHSNITKVGDGIMIGGGTMALLGAAALIGPWAKQHNDEYGDGYKTATNIALSGISITFGGVIIFLLGREYEKSHKDHFSFINKKNQIGFAYNF